MKCPGCGGPLKWETAYDDTEPYICCANGDFGPNKAPGKCDFLAGMEDHLINAITEFINTEYVPLEPYVLREKPEVPSGSHRTLLKDTSQAEAKPYGKQHGVKIEKWEPLKYLAQKLLGRE